MKILQKAELKCPVNESGVYFVHIFMDMRALSVHFFNIYYKKGTQCVLHANSLSLLFPSTFVLSCNKISLGL